MAAIKSGGAGEVEIGVEEAARLLRLSRPAVINLMHRGELSYRKVGLSRRIPRREVLCYREALLSQPEDLQKERRRILDRLRTMAEITSEAGEGY